MKPSPRSVGGSCDVAPSASSLGVPGGRGRDVGGDIGAEPTDERFERPADFDLGTAWTDVVEEMEGRRSRVLATVLADPQSVRDAVARLGSELVTAYG